MAKTRLVKPRIRYRTKVKTKLRNVYHRVQSRSRSKSGHKHKHLDAVLMGTGIGSGTATALQIIDRNLTSVAFPKWLSPLTSLVLGIAHGKVSSHSWQMAIEEGLTAAGTAYVTDRAINAEPIIGSIQSGLGLQGEGVIVY